MLERVWDDYVFPDWDRVITEPRTSELWWRGITPRSRGAVWQRAIGNDLALSPESYAKALQRAQNERKAMEAGTEPLDGAAATTRMWFSQIRADAPTAFPELQLFAPYGPLYGSLVDVLDAYTMYRSDVGYQCGDHVGVETVERKRALTDRLTDYRSSSAAAAGHTRGRIHHDGECA